MPPLYRDPDWLHRRYHDEGRTQREIADECDVSPRTIRKWMDRYDIETRDVEGENHGLYGQSRSEETRQKISETMQGRKLSQETRRRMSDAHRGNHIDTETRQKIARSLRGLTRDEQTRRQMSESTAGEQNPNWRGGYSKRYGAGWKQARARVRESNDECQHCGHDGTEYRLEVHHIVPVRVFRETEGVEVSDAHAPENLVLLCKRCHGRAEHGHIEFSVPMDSIPDSIGEIYT